MKLSGLYTALITPMKDEEVDFEAIVENIEFQKKCGVDGIVAASTTGEGSSLKPQEKKEIIQLTRKYFPETLVVATGCSSTDQTIENSLIAQDLGADLLLIVSPYYIKPNQQGIYKHYQKICEKVDLPIIIYNVASRTGCSIDASTAAELAHLPKVIGIKECNPCLHPLTEMIHQIKKFRSDFYFFTGDDCNIFSSLLLGADGVISVLGNIIPQELKQFLTYLQLGDLAQARIFHEQLQPFFKILLLDTNPIVIKEAMNFYQMNAGDVRLPLTKMSDSSYQKMVKILQEYSLTSCLL